MLFRRIWVMGVGYCFGGFEMFPSSCLFSATGRNVRVSIVFLFFFFSGLIWVSDKNVMHACNLIRV